MATDILKVGVQGIVTSVAISKTGNVLAFGDYRGAVTLWADASRAMMNDFSRNIALCDPPSINMPYSDNDGSVKFRIKA